MSNYILFAAQLKKEYIYIRRYLFNAVGGLLTFYIVFLLLFLGYRGLAGGTEMYGTGLGNLIVGFLLWMSAMLVYQDISHTLFMEAREGILEQLYMSPYGYTRVTGFRVIASFLVMMSMVIVILFAMMISTGRYLNLDVLSLLPLVIIMLLGIAGIGFILGGLQLLFKRIQNFLQVVQFLLVGLVAAPVEGSFFAVRFLPATLASHQIRQIMVQEMNITQLNFGEIILALAIGMFYLVLGLGVFKICERKAMREGRLAQF